MADVLDRAIVFATEKHSGQLRKFGNLPYIVHPMEVATIISTITNDRELIAAGMLHDTVEDCNVDPLEIRKLFGPRVAALVASESEDKLSERPPEETWLERKQESLLMLKYTKDMDVKILWLADKLSNIRSFYRVYLEQGDAMWLALHQKDPEMQYWYYKTVAECVTELSDTPAYQEFVIYIKQLFKKGE